MSFTCPRCGMASAHPEDEQEGYCGNCHDWTGEPYVCPNGHPFPGVVAVRCKECEAEVACEPTACGMTLVNREREILRELSVSGRELDGERLAAWIKRRWPDFGRAPY